MEREKSTKLSADLHRNAVACVPPTRISYIHNDDKIKIYIKDAFPGIMYYGLDLVIFKGSSEESYAKGFLL